MIVILMGVSGSGKSTVGRLLAAKLGWDFYEGDDYHPPENVAKMARGEPLTDADRNPWLSSLEALIRELLVARQSGVLACSALKTKYRDRLVVDPQQVRLVYLAGSPALIMERLKARVGHFMKAALLNSQFEALEAPKDVVTINIGQPPEALVRQIREKLEIHGSLLKTQVLLSNLMFPEAPRWHAGAFWFTDQHARRIVRLDGEGRAETASELDDLPGGLGWLPDGRLLVVSMTQRKVLVLEDGGLQEYADLAALASFHCNDMVVDDQGRAYVGNFGFDLHGGADISPAELVLVTPDREARIVARELVFPNGAVITPDGKTLLVAETFASRITAFTREADGSLGKRRLWADLGEANPDGICLDEEGRLWIAAPAPGEVLCVEEGGRLIDRVTTVGTPYACMLGGPERRTLFITSSETDDPALAKEKKSGRIESVDVAVAGVG